MNAKDWNERAEKLMHAKQTGYITSREYEREFEAMYQQMYGDADARRAKRKHPKKGG